MGVRSRGWGSSRCPCLAAGAGCPWWLSVLTRVLSLAEGLCLVVPNYILSYVVVNNNS